MSPLALTDVLATVPVGHLLGDGRLITPRGFGYTLQSHSRGSLFIFRRQFV
jgi:hypothetical protein